MYIFVKSNGQLIHSNVSLFVGTTENPQKLDLWYILRINPNPRVETRLDKLHKVFYSKCKILGL